MKFSTATLNYYRNLYGWSDDVMPDGIDALVTKIGAQLGAVEAVNPVSPRYHGALLVKVVSCEKHPDADRLNVCKIDDGGVSKTVERLEDGLVQVVCGAPNVRAGMTAVWLPPASTVPSTFDSDPFVLEARPLRGVVSNGMLASPKELALGDSHEGLLEVTDEFEPGTTFVTAFNLEDDYIIDIENKMFTHRPDCFGYLGIARELAGIQDLAFKSPEWYRADADLSILRSAESETLPLTVQNELPELVPRFTAITIKDVQVGPSPIWLQVELAKVGQKPINNVVDLTNYLMLLTSQPMHAYDYDKVAERSKGDATIVVRHPKDGETVKLLNGKEITPRKEAIMIATDQELIGVGGAMGGSDTEVDASTKNIIIECANFDMYSIRRTSMAHGLFTDAVTRFNKGQSPYQNLAVLAKMVTDTLEVVGGQVAGELIDINHTAAHVDQPELHEAKFINERLGTSLELEDIKRILQNVEFAFPAIEGRGLLIQPPFWRTDIHILEDVVEEVGRLQGFDKLPLVLPPRSSAPAHVNQVLAWKSKVRNALASLGANEVLTYSFVHGNLLQQVGQDTDQAFRLNNALSPDLQYYRLSLTPSLLANVHRNIKAGHDEFALFEINKTHTKLHAADDDGVPKEFEMIALTYANKQKSQYAAYYQARVYLDRLTASLGFGLEYRPVTEDLTVAVAQPFEVTRSALVYIAGTDIGLGIIGEYKRSVAKKLKLPAQSAGFEIGLQELMEAPTSMQYRPLSRFPSVSQDICLQVEDAYDYATTQTALREAVVGGVASDEYVTTYPIDIYTDESIKGHVRFTYRVTLTSYDRTLTDSTLSAVLDAAVAKLTESLGAIRI